MNKYWETETPTVLELGKNQIRLYPVAGKIQVYPLVPGTRYGVGSGATIDLALMDETEVEALVSCIRETVQQHTGRVVV